MRIRSWYICVQTVTLVRHRDLTKQLLELLLAL